MQKHRFLKLLLLTIVLIVSKSATSQNTFNGIFFQAIARDNFSNPAKDRIIHIQSTIIQTTLSGTKVLVEEHKSQTDGTGVFSISIGQGTRIGGTASNLSAIEWAKGPYFLNLQIAIEPIVPSLSWDYKKEWVDLGTTPFGTVPYALYSGSSGALDDKLSIADTAKMLTIYAKAQVVNNLSTQVNSKLSAADTTTMLAPYAKMVNALVASNITSLTAATVNAALDSKVNVADSGKIYVTPLAIKKRDSISLASLELKLNIADSGSKYVTPLQLKGVSFDTASLITKINKKVNLADSTTVFVTPLQLAAKTFDSTAIYTQLALKLNKTDTSALLRKSDTTTLSNRINLKVNNSDVIDVAHGGTGLTTIGTNGQLLTSNGSILSWTNPSAMGLTAINGLTAGTQTLTVGNLGTVPNFVSSGSTHTLNIPMASSTGVTKGLISNIDYTNFSNKIDASQKGVANGIASLDVNSKVPASQIPVVSFQSANVVSSQSAMLALSTAVIGSIAIRTDVNENFVLSASDPSVLSNWVRLAIPTSVTSVNGYAGPTVSLTTADIAPSANRNYVTTTQLGVLSNTSGTNTGDQTITLTGDVTGIGTGSFVTTVNSIGGVSSSTIASLPTSVAANTSSITSNKNSIATLNTNVSANTASITAETTRASIAESALDTRITSNTSSITSNKNSIATLNTNVSTNTASITAETTRATNAENALDTRVASNTASITSNTNSINTLTTNVNTNTSSITTNISDITSLTSRVNTATSSITSNTADIATLNTSLSNKANLNSPIFTGTPSLPSGTIGITQTTGDNSPKLATTAFVAASITASSAGLSSVGPISGTSNANGAIISGTTQLILTPANANFGGIVTTATQTFAGAKTFTNTATFGTDINVNGLTVGKGGGNNIANTAIGSGALALNTSGTSSTAFGYNALSKSTAGYATAFGTSALENLTGGTSNVAIGYAALMNTSSQNANTAVGDQSMRMSTGANNTALGSSALYGVSGKTTGNNNTAIGNSALTNATTAAYNVGVGSNSLNNITSGNDNTVLGYQSGYYAGAGTNLTSMSQGVLIGSNVRAGTNTSTNEIAIGYNVIGNGSNTVTIGNYSNTANYFRGDINLTGNINGGTWSGTTISAAKGGTGLTSPGASGNVLTSDGINWISSPPAAVSAGTLTGTTLASNITSSSITSLGTITSGTWSGTTIGSNVGGAGTVNGLLKANGSGVVSAAVAGTDFQAPLTTTQVGVLSNTSGTNTGDQTITLTGDVTGIGTGTFTTTLTNSGVIAGSYGSNTSIPTFTVDAKGRLTSAGTITSTAVPYTGATQAVNLGAYDLTVNGLTVGTGVNGGAVSNTNTALGTSALAGNNSGSGANTAIGTYALKANTTGSNNTGIGYYALQALTTATDNTALGAYALRAGSSGYFNTSIGSKSMFSATSGANNTAVGVNALYGITTAGNNTAMGFLSLNNLTTGDKNIALGYKSGSGVTSGTSNIMIGANTGSFSMTTGSYNTIIGTDITGLPSTLSNNIILADGAGNIRAQHNGTTGWALGTIASGTWSGTSIAVANGGTGATTASSAFDALSPMTTTGDIIYGATNGSGTRLPKGSDGQVLTMSSGLPAWITNSSSGGINSIGAISGTSNVNGATISGTTELILTPADANNGGIMTTQAQTFVGVKTFSPTVTATANLQILSGLDINPTFNNSTFTGVGNYGLRVQGVGIGRGGGNLLENTAVGNSALYNNGTGVKNTAVGVDALKVNYTGQNNTAIGYQAASGLGSISGVTAVGSSVLVANQGSDNTAIGAFALTRNTTGINNTVVGSSALSFNRTGNNNVVMGHQALLASVLNSSDDNTAIGFKSMYNNTTGGTNTIIGSLSGFNNTTGAGNASYGFKSLYNNQAGSDNVALGNNSGSLAGSGVGVNLTSSNQSIFIGSGTRAGTNTSTNEVVIGYGAIGNGSNTVTIGTASNTANYFTGDINLTGNVSGGTWSGTAIGVTKGGTGLASPGASGNVLTSDGTAWVSSAPSGVSSITTIGTTPNTNGATITSGVLRLQPANTSNGGVVTTGIQTFAGAKTFSSDLNINGLTVGRGGSSGISNTAFGSSVLGSNTTNNGGNSGFGYNALSSLTSGSANTAIGGNSLQAITSSTSGNTAVGYYSLFNLSSTTSSSYNTVYGNSAMSNIISGSDNIAIGKNAGIYYGTGTTALTSSDQSIYIGSNVKAGTNNSTNEIVIGYNQTGNGSNTVTIGNNSNTKNYLTGDLILGGTGNITSGVWSATAIGVAKGGTGLTSVGTNGQVLSSDGTKMVWSNAGSGVSTLTYTTSSSYANGGTISGTSLTLSAADATNPGLVSVGAQTIGGAKTFSNTATFNSDISIAGNITSGVWSGTTISIAKGGTGLTSSGNNGNILTSDGTNWVSSALSTTYTSTASINGGTFSGTTLTLTAADVTKPGLLTASSQIIGGAKTFSNTATFNSDISIAGNITSGVWSGTAISIAKGGTGLTSSGNNGNILASDGTNWVSSALSTTYTSTASTNGGTFSGTTLTLTAADVTKPGLLTASSQIIGGAKTFTNTANFITDITVNNMTIGKGNNNLGANTVLGNKAGYSIATGGNYNSLFGYNAGYLVTSGARNVALGYNALNGNSNGVSGNSNVALGYNSLQGNSSGSGNLALGENALYTNVDGGYNVGLGHASLNNNTSGSYNIALGYQALVSNTTADNNIAIGQNALSLSVTGASNIGIGTRALGFTAASNNIALGYNAAYYYNTGSAGNYANSIANNIFIGHDVRPFTATDQNEIVIGNSPGALGTGSNGQIGLGSNSTLIGNSLTQQSKIYGALTIVAPSALANLDGNNSTIAAQNAITSGYNGGVLNLNAGNGVGSGNGGNVNITPGTTTGSGAAGKLVVSSEMLLNGISAGKGKGTGTNNAVFGLTAFDNNTTGMYNSSFGTSALNQNTTGAYNTAMGSFGIAGLAGSSNYNTSLGYQSGEYIADGSTLLTTSNQSVFIGAGTKAKQANASNEIVIGYNTVGNGSNTTTIGNYSTTATYIPSSLYVGGATTGSTLTVGKADGSVAGTIMLNPETTGNEGGQINFKQSISGSSNDWFIDQYGGAIINESSTINRGGPRLRFLPSKADAESYGFAINEYGNVGIGIIPRAPAPLIGDDSKLDVAGNATFYGKLNTSVGSATKVGIETDGMIRAWGKIETQASFTSGSFSTTSDKRLKTNIINLANAMDTLNMLRPVRYDKRYRLSDSTYQIKEFGFIAQELQKVLPQLVEKGTDKDQILSVNYISIIPLLTKAMQEQDAIIKDAQKENKQLKEQLSQQQKRLDAIEQALKKLNLTNN